MKKSPSFRLLFLTMGLFFTSFSLHAGNGGDEPANRSGSDAATSTSPGTTDFEITLPPPSQIRDGKSFTMSVDACKYGASKVQLLDQKQRLITEVSVTLDEGSNLLTIHIGDLGKGLYFSK